MEWKLVDKYSSLVQQIALVTEREGVGWGKERERVRVKFLLSL